MSQIVKNQRQNLTERRLEATWLGLTIVAGTLIFLIFATGRRGWASLPSPRPLGIERRVIVDKPGLLYEH